MNPKKLLNLYAHGKRKFQRINLSEANLRNVDLSGADFTHATLNVTNLSGANLSQVNFTHAKLNVARLSGANLTGATLNSASLNVANLIRATLNNAQLQDAQLIHAEIIRADLSRSNLSNSNLQGADLRETLFRETNLSYCNLTECNLRGAFLAESILEQAFLSNADLTRADLRAVNLREADLSQATLTCANLQGADLRGSNLRWTELGGADLRWADLSDAKLSGANLKGADLSGAILVNASLVHTDLGRARLIKVEWAGADLTGAILTGTRLHGVRRAKLTTTNLTCDWLDLSPQGDDSQIYQLTPAQVPEFFQETPPSVEVTVDAPFNIDANLALATIYHQVRQAYPKVEQPPSIRISSRRTYLKFRVESNEDLFLTAFYATLPFQDAAAIERHLLAFLDTLQTRTPHVFSTKKFQQLRQMNLELHRAVKRLQFVHKQKPTLCPPEAMEFLNAPTYTALANSKNKTLDIYHHPDFGKRLLYPSTTLHPAQPDSPKNITLPPLTVLTQFVQDCLWLGGNEQ
ncbi:pentapeptide repeat-containing protein [Spirulina sp. CS-785/01]|uniref:pentapeptide repeat-containing protein n=1 Tax=Spirulina sp. CS-785/01 TaxID=3021716 RepID=UPI00232D3274|nr:pentapeptide repeat-containing protein [Spirulina sp. CS-785/01]MDB9313501.1 pentapeptide repeat-containing protein [Spirulina sp. CS-785/01]